LYRCHYIAIIMGVYLGPYKPIIVAFIKDLYISTTMGSCLEPYYFIIIA
jgi:hypothetical protein